MPYLLISGKDCVKDSDAAFHSEATSRTFPRGLTRNYNALFRTRLKHQKHFRVNEFFFTR